MDVSSISLKVNPSGSSLYALSDAEFVQAIGWKSKASKEMIGAARDGDPARFAELWTRLHANRPKGAATGTNPHIAALWSRFAFPDTGRTTRLLELLESAGSGQKASRPGKKSGSRPGSGKKKGGRRLDAGRQVSDLAEEWLSDDGACLIESPFEVLAVCELLERVAGELSPQDAWQLWRVALTAAIRLNEHVDAPVGSHLSEDRRLLVAGELPWRLGLILAGVKGSGDLRQHGQTALRRSLLDNTDTDGTPDATLLQRLPLWLAPLVRSADAAERFDQPLWNGDTAERFELLVETVAPLCRPDGQLALTNGASRQAVSLLQTASTLAGLTKDSVARKYLLACSRQTKTKKANSARTSSVEELGTVPANQSDWAQLACLRTDWTLAANSLVVAHHGRMPLVELAARGKPLLSGGWEIELCLDGQPLGFRDDWECVCWHSDDDVDYVELQHTFGNGVCVDRQLLLSRDDDFALLADAVSGAGGSRIEYTATLPLSQNVMGEQSTESREGVLTGGGVTARLFPLALPDDLVLSTPGAFEAGTDKVRLKQVASRDGLYAPLLIDWQPQRRRKAAEWRTLTVSEAGSAVGPGVAAGHRLRIGKVQQLLIYRSLHNSHESRAVLGHHTQHETVIGKFQANGTVDPILLVEQS